MAAVSYKVDGRLQVDILEAQTKSPVHTEWKEETSLFRIVAFGEVGDWTYYQGIATLKHHGDLLIAVSSYHEGGLLEPEVVYSAKAVYE